MTKTMARYDGYAEAYDEHLRQMDEGKLEPVRQALGVGDGLCLDLGCGTGFYADVIASTGRVPIGIDISQDQLRIARSRHDSIVRGDAGALPFKDEVFPTVAAMWISTDVEDFASVMREAARVLRPGGLLVFYGVHPCFNGPCVENVEDGSRVVHPTYRHAGRHESSPWWGEGGIRRRIGMVHVPLAHLFNAIVDAGLNVERVLEPGEQSIPYILAIRARKQT